MANWTDEYIMAFLLYFKYFVKCNYLLEIDIWNTVIIYVVKNSRASSAAGELAQNFLWGCNVYVLYFCFVLNVRT